MFRKVTNILSRKRQYKDISPDEIFLDAENNLAFDHNLFEGKIERALAKSSSYLVLILFVLIALLFSVRLWVLQAEEGSAYFAQSQENRLEDKRVFANRGVIFDRNGVELAWNMPTEDEEYTKRSYITSEGFGNLLGFVKYPEKDQNGYYYRTYVEGQDGIEAGYDELLKGAPGLKIREVDATQELVSESTVTKPKHGENIHLSIDAQIQQKMYESIRDLAKEVDFKGGAGVMIDVATGEIITLVTYPGYSSALLTENDDVEAMRTLQEDDSSPFLNRATLGLYTPGSIVKPFVALGALNEGIIPANKEILSTGSISITSPYDPSVVTVFRDWKAHGWVDVRSALAVSSDVYFYAVGGGYEDQPGLGISKIEEYVRAFEMAEPTGLRIFPEATGVVPNPDWKEENFEDGTWRLGNTYHTSIGQYGFQVTPLQMARAIAGIATYGTLPTPHLIKGEEGKRSAVEKDISPYVYKVVQEGMREAVTSGEGTARGLNIAGISVAGKTGTAEIDAGKTRVHSWVTGFFPYESPRYSFAIVMERGPYNNLRGATAAMTETLLWMRDHTPEYFVPRTSRSE